MNRNKTWLTHTALLAAAALTGSAQAGTVLIDKTFDGVANDTGPAFQQIWNGAGNNNGSANTTTGLITTSTSGSNLTNSAYGFNNVSTIDVAALDPSAIGFTVTFEVSAVSFAMTTAPANGVFFGIVSGTDATSTTSAGLFNASGPDSFGYVAGATNYNDHVMYQKKTGQTAATSTRTDLPNPGDASYNDGFTISITLKNDNTWSITSTGLSTNLNASGSLDTANRFSYDDIDNAVGVYTSLQYGGGRTMDVDRLTLTTIVPEPGSLALLGLGGLMMLKRRRGC